MAESRPASGSQSGGMALLRISGLAGIFGPVTFVIVYTVFGFVSVGYSPITQVISNLELVQNGWVQQLNFLQCGTLIIVFAFGFRKTLLGTVQRHLRISTVLLVLSGAGMVDASYFTPATPIEHTIGFLFFIIPLTASFLLVGRQLSRSDSWQAIGIYTLVTGFATLTLLLSFFFLGASESFGVVEVVNRLFVMEALAWFVVIGTRLFRSKQ